MQADQAEGSMPSSFASSGGTIRKSAFDSVTASFTRRPGRPRIVRAQHDTVGADAPEQELERGTVEYAAVVVEVQHPPTTSI
jgi:hypothetical protein